LSVVVDAASNVENQREQRHPYQDAVIGLAKDCQVWVGVKIVIEFLRSCSGVSWQRVHDDGVRLAMLRIYGLIYAE
jgi:hypothetical protein